MPEAAPLLVVLTGPTGTGKSALALQLAERLQSTLPVEVISVDSAQVYRGMDIGTAKPDAAQRARLAHHLIDIRDPVESYSAGEFVRDALRAAEEIRARGHQPLLVGGTMLYLHALYEGLAALPQADAAVRAALDALAQLHGWPALHAELARIDPRAAARIAPADGQRIQRALEVWRVTGVPISEWQQRTQGARERYRWLRFALLPEDSPAGRAALRAHLSERLSAMLEAGLLQEVARLYARGDLTEQHAAVRAVGYRQLWRVFSAGAAPSEAQRAALTATAQLAKRQLTWLRRTPALIRLDAAAVGLAEALGTQILAAARA
ncbi:MAG TPA: tRNA (adenosine(37)-N6)-dimethylallyltransferase MiaA [Steroidobacteraceae bacterium]|jgi:tRNA dimethylallyltransferase|nr:tRNA (adenosine(37)-N6)-dimethylallyltransferase MiaA [Steroidobacteraceae bacterium]